ncbi:MAG: ribbon-helix-helix domain-containing protein [Alphaproteobacteria bacterium]|nr:ribbon-helix-helix domain-containing protein [Alphaproteobacteria bacterium]
MAKLTSRVIIFENKKTSIRLAEEEWDALSLICQKENIKRNNLLELINQTKNKEITLTNSVRLFSIIYFYNELIHLQNYDISAIQNPSITEAIHGIL